jgi:predicted nucleotidyltransferase
MKKGFAHMETAPFFPALPASIRRVVEYGVRAVDPERVILYGSRARGDAREHSDYDLAFVFPQSDRGKWVRFLSDLDDAPIALLPVDLLDLNEASESLRQRICKEGITLYERTAGQ